MLLKNKDSRLLKDSMQMHRCKFAELYQQCAVEII